jgi:hypothetical protein
MIVCSAELLFPTYCNSQGFQLFGCLVKKIWAVAVTISIEMISLIHSIKMMILIIDFSFGS